MQKSAKHVVTLTKKKQKYDNCFQRRRTTKETSVQCKDPQLTAAAVIAFSGRCCLFPFLHAPDPWPPLYRKQALAHELTQQT